MYTPAQLISLLDLKPHPEGGFYRETYRAPESYPLGSLPGRYQGDRSLSTAIYFLLTEQSFSAMHRLASDEVFHFYLGDCVEMLVLKPDRTSETIKLGQNIELGENMQTVVPQDWWQGLHLSAGGSFALLGCTVAPGFDFADFEEGKRATLQAAYPEASEMIARLTRK